MPGYTPPSCSMTPMRGASSACWVTGSSPRTRTDPPSGRRNPAMVSTVVVLPAPLGPSSATTSPASARKDTLATAVRSPKRTVRPATSMTDTDGTYCRVAHVMKMERVRRKVTAGPTAPSDYGARMLDVRRIRNDLDEVRAGLARRGEPATEVERVHALHARQREVAAERDELRSRIKTLSKQVGSLHREGQ